MLSARFLAGRWGEPGSHIKFHSPRTIGLECHGADVDPAERDASSTVEMSDQPASLAGAAAQEDSRDISPGTIGVHRLLRVAPTPAVPGSHTEDPKSHRVPCILGHNVQRGYQHGTLNPRKALAPTPPEPPGIHSTLKHHDL